LQRFGGFASQDSGKDVAIFPKGEYNGIVLWVGLALCPPDIPAEKKVQRNRHEKNKSEVFSK